LSYKHEVNNGDQLNRQNSGVSSVAANKFVRPKPVETFTINPNETGNNNTVPNYMGIYTSTNDKEKLIKQLLMILEKKRKSSLVPTMREMKRDSVMHSGVSSFVMSGKSSIMQPKQTLRKD